MKIDVSKAIEEKALLGYKEKTLDAFHTLINRTGEGNDFLGWLDLPEKSLEQADETIEALKPFRDKNLDTILIIGIGGSNLGAKAIIEALSNRFAKNKPEMLFAGNNLDEDYHHQLLNYLQDKNYGIVVISKSGTTTEPAIAFRIFKQDLENKIGKNNTKERIIVITDQTKGALRKLADENKYLSFVIPDNVGGRFSVLSPVGIVPIALANLNIVTLLSGAKDMKERLLLPNFETNPAMQYAATRNYLYQNQHYITEILVNYNTSLTVFAEWWKQLFGESEGKNKKGIFPASANFTTDLHSLGQFIQDGTPRLFETIINVKKTINKLTIPHIEDNNDGLDYLAGKRISEVNEKAFLGTLIAHTSSSVPNIVIEIDRIDEYFLGELIFFFEFSCAISGYMLGVNPFNQPGVEQYKRNMFALLNKPGYEHEKEHLERLLNK